VLLLTTVLLVVAGLVLLVLGYVQSSMTILYASIGTAALAGVVLIVFSRLNRRRALALAAKSDGADAARPTAPAAVPEPGPIGEQTGEEPTPG
jgi:hypothetical protein